MYIISNLVFFTAAKNAPYILVNLLNRLITKNQEFWELIKAQLQINKKKKRKLQQE